MLNQARDEPLLCSARLETLPHDMHMHAARGYTRGAAHEEPTIAGFGGERSFTRDGAQYDEFTSTSARARLL